jgi:hypothetical protein
MLFSLENTVESIDAAIIDATDYFDTIAIYSAELETLSSALNRLVLCEEETNFQDSAEYVFGTPIVRVL